MEIKKYTPDQLSRILSVAAVGELGDAARYYVRNSILCIEQAALADPDVSPDGGHGARMDEWDDNYYTRPSRPVPVLRWLEGKGFA